MNSNQQRDPRIILSFFNKLSILGLFFLPFIYFNLKANNFRRLSLALFLYIIIAILLRKFDKRSKDENLHNSVFIGALFSIGCFLLALMLGFVIMVDYFNNNISPSYLSLILITFLLFLGFTLLYLSMLSRLYEKTLS